MLEHDLSQSRQALEAKIREANNSLIGTARVVEEVQSLLKEKAQELEFLRMEYERYSKLASVERRKARIVIDQVERSLTKRQGRERLERLVIGLISGFIIFILGILFGPNVRTLLGMH